MKEIGAQLLFELSNRRLMLDDLARFGPNSLLLSDNSLFSELFSLII